MNFIDIGYWWTGNTGLMLDILKMESWNHIGCTANILNIVIKDTYFCIHQQKRAFFYDGTAFSWVPKLVLFFYEIGIKKVLKRSYFSFVQSCRNPVMACENKTKHFLVGQRSLVHSDAIWRPRSGSRVTGSVNGLLPEGTKPLLETMLTYHQCVSAALTDFAGSTWDIN